VCIPVVSIVAHRYLICRSWVTINGYFSIAKEHPDAQSGVILMPEMWGAQTSPRLVILRGESIKH
jgi:hypothetical protein